MSHCVEIDEIWLAFECYHSWPAAGGDDPAVHADVDGEEGEEDDEEDGEHADDHDLHRGQESSETWYTGWAMCLLSSGMLAIFISSRQYHF